MLRPLFFACTALFASAAVQAQPGWRGGPLRFSLEYGRANPSDRLVGNDSVWGLAIEYRLRPKWRIELAFDAADFFDGGQNTKIDLERRTYRLGAVYKPVVFLSLTASLGSGRYEERRRNPNNPSDARIDESGPVFSLGAYGHLTRRWGAYLRYQRIDLDDGFFFQATDYEETSFGVRFSFP